MRVIIATILCVLAGLYGVANAALTAVAYAHHVDPSLPAKMTVGAFVLAFVFALAAE